MGKQAQKRKKGRKKSKEDLYWGKAKDIKLSLTEQATFKSTGFF